MKQEFNQIRILTIASLKMFFRNKTAIFFSLFIPLFIMIIFGLIMHNSNTQFNLGIADNANNTASRGLITTLKKTGAFTITQKSQTQEISRLKQGDEDLVLSIPADFAISPTNTATIPGYFDQAKAQNATVAFLIINQVLSSYNEQMYVHTIGSTPIHHFIQVEQKGIETNNLTQIDFLIPGIIAFSIMQLGIFSVAFAFTSMKKTGALRRLQATPAKPSNFILSQAIGRLILSFLQVAILLSVGIFFFNLHMYGNFLSFFVFIILGAFVFLSIGFAVAGYAKDENQAAPIANLISFPMMFLSGIFFPRSLMPDILNKITSVFPLTYLSDALRSIANNGTSITQLQGDFLGLLIWAIIAMIIAIKVFKWE